MRSSRLAWQKRKNSSSPPSTIPGGKRTALWDSGMGMVSCIVFPDTLRKNAEAAFYHLETVHGRKTTQKPVTEGVSATNLSNFPPNPSMHLLA